MSSGNLLEELGGILEEKRGELRKWFTKKRGEVAIPIYGSVDIRDSGFKVAVVDANHFPAGFNNVAEEDIPRLSQLMQEHIERSHPGTKHIHLYPESH
ncbi:MAG TPA: glutamate--cysteine ligase, partial [Candidatus Poseidoniales archaeon]|nr:glutamate--cysteine ligase [Candidatus Poseidoniales archaeon]